MKKALSLILATLLCIGMLTLIPVAAKDDETTASPVTTAAEFAAMNPTGSYYLDADIEITVSYAGTFSGIFDGKNHKITTTVPLFDTFKGTAKDLTIAGTVTDTAEGNLGAFAREGISPTLTNITNTASVTGNTGKGNIAGLIGHGQTSDAALIITDCKNTGTITGYCIGGILGKIESNVEIRNCVNEADIIGVDATGGIIAWEVENFIIENCINGNSTTEFTVSADTDAAAGVLGYISKGSSGTISGCKNYAKIDNTGTASGGITGRSGDNVNMSINSCENYGKITTAVKSAAGISALAGAGCEYIFTGCINRGEVHGTSGKYGSGGIAGETGGSFYFTGCVNYGDITSDVYDAGGMGGYAGGLCSAEFCFNYGKINAANSGGGIIAHCGQNKVDSGNYIIIFCGNEGDVIGAGNCGGGIIGYAYGNASHAPIINNCYNTGNISSGCEVAAFIGYVNGTTALTVKNCFNTGVITGTGEAKPCALFYSNNSALVAEGNVTGNYYTADCAKFATFDNQAYTDMAPNITAADIASGKLAYTLNQAIGSEEFFQTIGTDAHPVLDKTHGKVYEVAENTYSNTNEPPVTPPTGNTAVIILAVISIITLAGVSFSMKKSFID